MSQPTFDAHDLGSRSCWCDPDLIHLCPVCEPGERAADEHKGDTRREAIEAVLRHADPDCWRCDGDGYVPADEAAPDTSALIAHNYS